MMDSPRSSVRRAWLGLAAACAALVASCQSLPSTTDDVGEDGRPGCRDCPGCTANVCKSPTMMALAHDLDDLEEHIDKYGSVVAKQPDVWGQARLQQYRWEFENQMKGELGAFAPSLQGSLSRTDQAYFSDALMLTSAASAQGSGGTATVNSNTNTNQTSLPPVVNVLGTPVAPLPPLQPNFPLSPAATATAGTTTGAVVNISLEPTERLDQEARYINYLHELRRINQGDDTADSPGYALNLVRIPVSLLPGKKTRIGHGAEATMTLTPYLSDELLPTTFRNLVVNDLVDQLGLPLTQALNDCEVRCLLETPYRSIVPVTECTKPAPACARCQSVPAGAVILPAPGEGPQKSQPAHPGFGERLTLNESATIAQFAQIVTRRRFVVPATKDRRAHLPFPSSQMEEVYGDDFLYNGALEAYATFHDDLAANPVIHFPDVQSYLQEELNAAWKMLADPHNVGLWDFCTQDLATMVRSHRHDQLAAARGNFQTAVAQIALPEAHHQTAVGLAWAIIVESTLLNDQLVQDMKESASLKGCACLPPGWLPYFLPAPPPEARQAFNDYVRCRWPIHVFALDPENQEQNIADQFSRRREMQLALSLAFVRGEISASNMSQYARRINTDMDTIDLNRTAVGFSHGDDTFGWRFYPRYQTADVESNATVFFRDLLIGGPNRDQDLAERRLEPGERECIAVVVMPSFVPYATLEVSTNWFRLTDPKCKELNAAQAMRLSRSVKAIRNCGCQVSDQDCYRDGDLSRLMRKAQQLEDRLPLQTMTVQVPYENALGGFAMFNTGVTDLAPELTGWYGSPVMGAKGGTTLFLVGRHFSVLGTRLVVGGVDVPTANMELLSREVLKVTVPSSTLLANCDNGHYPESVDVQLATPYGVTSHLLIPVAAVTPTPTAGLSWGKDGQVYLAYAYRGVGIAPSNPPTVRPGTITARMTAKAVTVPDGSYQVALQFPDNDRVLLPNAVPFANNACVVQGTDLTAVFAKFGPQFTQQNPPQPQAVSKIILQALDKNGKPTADPPISLDTDLTINWAPTAG